MSMHLAQPPEGHDGTHLYIEDLEQRYIAEEYGCASILAVDPGMHLGMAVLYRSVNRLALVAARYLYLRQSSKPFSTAVKLIANMVEEYRVSGLCIETGFHAGSAMSSDGTRVDGAIRSAFELSGLPVRYLHPASAYAIACPGKKNRTDASIREWVNERFSPEIGEFGWGKGGHARMLPTHVYDAILLGSAALLKEPLPWSGEKQLKKGTIHAGV